MNPRLAMALLCFFPLSAGAAVTANVAVTNDYIFRGISNSGHQPALQGGLDYLGDTGWYAGTWLSNVDFNDGRQARYEMDLYAGHAGSQAAYTWDVGILSFSYPGAAKSLKYDSYKYRVDLRHISSHATVGLYYDFYHDYFGSGVAHYLETMAIVPLLEGVNLDLRLGRQRLTDNAALGVPDYTFRAISLQKRSGDWDMRLTWQSNGLSSSECFAGQVWCGAAVNLLLTRYFTLPDGR